MESIITALTTNKVLLAILILLLALIVYSIIKRLVKIIIILIIALVIYLGYMDYRGEKIEEKLQPLLNKSGIDINEIQKKTEKLKDVIDAADKISK